MPLLAGRYELGATLGAGGYATVYRARDPIEDRDVAIKVLPPSLFREAGDDAATQFDRFRNEALALLRLRSRYVARVLDFGRDDLVGLYLVMDLIEGVPLEARAIGRSLLPHEVLRVARGILAGLAEAHGAGIVHCDIKPANILIPRGRKALDEPCILDFGIARQTRRAVSADSHGQAPTKRGIVLGTPAYMAPEQLGDGVIGPAVDVYAAGLVLFDLLDAGPLFPGATGREQITARLSSDAKIDHRVPSPLSALLTRMLARDPATRFRDAAEALAAIGDLETAPVTVAELFPPEAATTKDDALPADRPSAAPRSTPTPRSIPTPRPSQVRSSNPPGADRSRSDHDEETWGSRSSFVPEVPPPRASGGIAFGAKRLSRLAKDPRVALIETLNALDLAMIDALARRERGSNFARVARAVALALRLELDAASLIIEPLAAQDDLARAFGCALISPRARKATRSRVEQDRNDTWIDAIDPELAAMLASLATAMTLRDDAAKNEARCRRAVERMGNIPSAARTTARMAATTAACLKGTLPTSSAMTEMLRLRDEGAEPPSHFHTLVRALLLGLVSFRADEHIAREQLERASKLAADTSNTLLEARAMVAWGGMLVEIPERVEQGLSVLERATTLLAHGDAPSLEHIAEHNRGAALVIQGHYAEAAPHLRRAREAAKGELSLEHEILSCMNEGFSHICLGQRDASARVVDELTDARLALVSPRTAAYSHVVRSMFAMLFKDADLARTELRRAHLRAAEAEAEGADAYLLAEALGILYASGRDEEIDLHARAAELRKLATERGFVSFYWFDVLRAMVGQIREAPLRAVVGETLERLIELLAPVAEGAAR